MNVDYDTVRITIRFENGSDDPNHYPYYDECGFDPGPLTLGQAHRLLQIHLHGDTVPCRQKRAALRVLETAGQIRLAHQSAERIRKR